MTTIQIEVPASLAERLQRYQHDLPRILEQGLLEVERADADRSMAADPRDTVSEAQTEAVLRRLGATGPDADERRRYLAERELQGWTPPAAGDQSLSEMIVEERDSRPWGKL